MDRVEMPFEPFTFTLREILALCWLVTVLAVNLSMYMGVKAGKKIKEKEIEIENRDESQEEEESEWRFEVE